MDGTYSFFRQVLTTDVQAGLAVVLQTPLHGMAPRHWQRVRTEDRLVPGDGMNEAPSCQTQQGFATLALLKFWTKQFFVVLYVIAYPKL